MSTSAWGLLALFLILLIAMAWPLGVWLARISAGNLPGWMHKVEAPLYRLAGTEANHAMHWKQYSFALLAFNVLGVLVVYLLQLWQAWLPLNPAGMAAVSPDSAFNTAISFVSNTNWQGYGGESTMSYFTQMVALAVQNFLSAATGIAVVFALFRGFAAKSSSVIGNFWVDITRITAWVLLPLTLVFAVFLVGQGVVQNFDAYQEVTTLEANTFQKTKFGSDGQALMDDKGQAVMEDVQAATQTLAVGDYPGSAAVPGVPTYVSATLGTTPSLVVLRFFGPADSGGSAISTYTVRSSDGTLSMTGTDSPITITCASTCNGYAFAVQATNVSGTGALSAAVHVYSSYQITARWYEPDTQPNDSVFSGTFTLDSTAGTVSNLSGTLTESMTGSANGSTPMTTVGLTHQLATATASDGGFLVSSFALNTTQVFSPGGYADTTNGLFYGYPSAYNAATANSFVTVYINPANPQAALTMGQINWLVYGDCAPGGMMGDACMTGVSGGGTMGGYPVSQSVTRK